MTTTNEHPALAVSSKFLPYTVDDKTVIYSYNRAAMTMTKRSGSATTPWKMATCRINAKQLAYLEALPPDAREDAAGIFESVFCKLAPVGAKQ